jgi:predicted peptidase
MIRHLFAAILLLVTLPAAARKADTGFLDRTVTVAGTSYRYQVFVPNNWTKKEKWPVVLFLHGSGERGDTGLLQTDVGLPHAIRTSRKPVPFVVVIPQCLTEHVWTEDAMEAQALAALDQSIKEFNGDRDRVYLTGLSMGGYGTWDLAAKYPGRFAAYVPVCGGVSAPKDFPQIAGSLGRDHNIADSYAETAKRIGKTPVWIFHGDADDAVPVEESRKMAEALKAAGANYKYTEYPGVGHNSWDKAYAEPELVPWLLEQRLLKPN